MAEEQAPSQESGGLHNNNYFEYLKKQILSEGNVPSKSQLKAQPALESVDVKEVLDRLVNITKIASGDSFLNEGTHDHSDAIALAESFVAYLRINMSSAQLNQFASIVNGQTINWIHFILNLPPAMSGMYTRTMQDARVSAMREALGAKFPNHGALGFRAFKGKLPLVYSTWRGQELNHALYLLGLPLSSLRIISSPGELTEDLTKQKAASEETTPFVVLVRSGSEIGGDADDIKKYGDIAKSQELWLHVEGEGAILLSSPDCPAILTEIRKANSFVFNAALFFQSTRYEITTVFYRSDLNHRHEQPKAPEPIQSVVEEASAPVDTLIDHGLISLPLWFVLQRNGLSHFRECMQVSKRLVTHLFNRLQNIPNIITESPPYSMQVLFRYQPTSSVITSKNPQKTLDAINEQILHDMNCTSAIDLDLELVKFKGHQCIRYHPIVSCNVSRMSVALIDSYITKLSTEVGLIENAYTLQPVFKKLVDGQEDLHNIQLPNFVGLGAVRYIPSLVVTGDSMPDKLASDVNALNEAICKQLSASHQIYTQSKDIRGDSVIALALDTSPLTKEKVEYHVNLIKDTAVELEKKSPLLTTIGDILSDSIKQAEEAQKKIQGQEEYETYVDGVMRSVPLLGSVYGWWNPPPTHDRSGLRFSLQDPKLTKIKHPERTKPSPEPVKKENGGGDEKATSHNGNTDAAEPAVEPAESEEEEPVESQIKDIKAEKAEMAQAKI